MGFFMRLFRRIFPVRASCDFKGVRYESHWLKRLAKKLPHIIDEPMNIYLTPKRRKEGR